MLNVKSTMDESEKNPKNSQPKLINFVDPLRWKWTESNITQKMGRGLRATTHQRMMEENIRTQKDTDNVEQFKYVGNVE